MSNPKSGNCGVCDNQNELAEDSYCFGCRTFICHNHYGDTPFGSHSASDHISDDDGDE